MVYLARSSSDENASWWPTTSELKGNAPSATSSFLHQLWRYTVLRPTRPQRFRTRLLLEQIGVLRFDPWEGAQDFGQMEAHRLPCPLCILRVDCGDDRAMLLNERYHRRAAW